MHENESWVFVLFGAAELRSRKSRGLVPNGKTTSTWGLVGCDDDTDTEDWPIRAMETSTC